MEPTTFSQIFNAAGGYATINGMPYTTWRANLQQASYMGAPFYCETAGEAGGRRNVVHECPHLDTPYTEDLGRKARRFTMSAYVLGDDYTDQRDTLIAACETEGPNTLQLPTYVAYLVNCESFQCSETRERGGICVIEMNFVEAGSLNGIGGVLTNTAVIAQNAAAALSATTGQSLTNVLNNALSSGTISL